MITCDKCSKENQDHYKFCLGCGAELPREAAAKSFSAATPPQGVAAVAAPEATAAPGDMGQQPPPDGTLASADVPASPSASPIAASAPPAAAPAAPAAAAPAASAPPAAAPAAAAPAAEGAALPCPQCGHENPNGNRFCASCGYNLSALQAAAPAAPAAASAPAPASSILLTALRADGSEAGTYPLPDGDTVPVGRDTGSIFAGDSYLSPRHATFLRREGSLSIKDEGSLNGVYLKVQPQVPCLLEFGDIFRIGQEIVRFEALNGQADDSDGVRRLGSPSNGYIGRLALVVGRDTTGNAFPIPDTGVHCGRERGDILFSEDGYVSGLHCRIAPEADGKVYLTDVGSSNGTFVRLKNEHQITSGDVLLMGQQLFRVDM
ncbi:MAG: FHA domain-containing protein [Polyangiaceae bacterium]|nr:FHA domain-containing protein [Polyangiaceae bacterium]